MSRSLAPKNKAGAYVLGGSVNIVRVKQVIHHGVRVVESKGVIIPFPGNASYYRNIWKVGPGRENHGL